MSQLSIDIDRVILDAVAGDVHNAQRLGPVLERALARLLAQENLIKDFHPCAQLTTNAPSLTLRGGDEQFAEQVARALLRALQP